MNTFKRSRNRSGQDVKYLGEGKTNRSSRPETKEIRKTKGRLMMVMIVAPADSNMTSKIYFAHYYIVNSRPH